jgi:hypothetical protein
MFADCIKKKPLSLTPLLLLFLTFFGITGCQKEMSKETAGPGGGSSGGSAVFALVPTGGQCSDAVVAGSFEAGISGDGQLTVTVNVTKAGDWTYSTAMVNGFVFAGAGNFTATGTQVITLLAVGKPTAAGNFDFNLNIGGATCKVTVTVNPAGSGGVAAEFYYKATIDGTNYMQGATDVNGFEPGSGMGGMDDVVFGGGINYINPPLPAGLTEFGIDKGMMHNYLTATPAQFKAFFTPGDYPYAPTSYSDGNGVKIFWTDTKGENWSTRNGPVDQAGSTFKIISAQDIIDLAGNYYLKVKVQFNCKLYHETTGAMKQVTNGEAVVAFGML